MPADFKAVYKFVCELQNKSFDQPLMQALYDENIANPEHIYLVATMSDNPIGYTSCHIQNLLHHGGKVAEIQEMFVASAYRSQGVGKLMMREIKREAEEKGSLQLEVTTRAVREKAIQFYMRESFEDSHKKLVHYFKNSTSA